jgi:hypothetical protein
MTTNGINNIYLLDSDNRDEYQQKPEYDLMLILEKWRSEDGHTCINCGSDNTEVVDVDVDGYRLYNFSRLVKKCEHQGLYMFNLNIGKKGGQFSVQTGGSPAVSKEFAAQAFEKINQVILSKPLSSFKSHENGKFFISVLETLPTNSTSDKIVVQKLTYAGLSKDDITRCIENCEKQMGLS